MRFVRSFLVVLLLLTPLVLVGATVLYYAMNIPYWDDYRVQNQLQMLVSQPTAFAKIQHLFDQHFEHRIVWTRLIFLTYYKLNGQLNYYVLTLIGVSGLFVLLALLLVAFRRLKLPLAYFIPVPFWIFTLQSHENLIWAMASIQNFYVLVFAVGTFYGLAQNTAQSRILAIGLAVMATFTSGNGLVVLLVGLCVLAVQRNSRWFIGWALLTASCLLGYFYNYYRVTFFPSPYRYSYLAWIKAFFVFLGGFIDPYPYSGAMAVGYRNPLILISLFGGLLTLAMGYFIGSSQFKSRSAVAPPLFWDDFFTGIALFLLATAAITVYSRVGFAGPGYLLQGRYKVYPALAVSSVYLYSLYRWRSTPFFKPYTTVVVLTTTLFSLFTSYLCLEGIINQHRRTIAAYVNWLSEASHQDQLNVKPMYSPFQRLSVTADTTLLHSANLLHTPATTKFSEIYDGPFIYSMAKTDALNPTPARPLDGSYILLKSTSHSYVFAARPRRPSPMALGDLQHYFSSDTFYAQVLKEDLAPGRYRIGILMHKAEQSTVQMTDQYVTFTGF